MQSALHVDNPDRNKWDNRRQRKNAEEQDEHGVVTLHATIDLRRLIPDTALLVDAEGAKVFEILPAEGSMEVEEKRLKAHQEQPLDHLSPAKITEAHDQRRQARPHIALHKAGDELREETGLLRLFAAYHSKTSFRIVDKSIWNFAPKPGKEQYPLCLSLFAQMCEAVRMTAIRRLKSGRFSNDVWHNNEKADERISPLARAIEGDDYFAVI